ncbi:MAG: hypothetical protein LQ342_005002 [Letrouitia transgressa]|nr:MAG: hypothetical protein LQ342_005002 [Letrouitia transgressa]
MDNLDASEHYDKTSDEPLPSLLTIILDTSPPAWSLLSSVLPFSSALADLLVFINAHLACNNSNRVCVIAAHPHRAEYLYPARPSSSNANDSKKANNDHLSHLEADSELSSSSYRPFSLIRSTLLSSLWALLAPAPTTAPFPPFVALSGALTLALTHISKTILALSPPSTKPTTTTSNLASDAAITGNSQTVLNSRILIISLTGHLSAQYIPLSNAQFACQRLRIPIDVCKLSGDANFLQQASDVTGGIFLNIKEKAGLLQYLMMAFLPDQVSRGMLVGFGEMGVDFQVACFCHRRVVATGWVCSICLSVFCEPPEDATCLTCGTHLRLENYGRKPAVVVRKKKKRRNRIDGEATRASSAAGTPGP